MSDNLNILWTTGDRITSPNMLSIGRIREIRRRSAIHGRISLTQYIKSEYVITI
jgi:hypothetical protein